MGTTLLLVLIALTLFAAAAFTMFATAHRQRPTTGALVRQGVARDRPFVRAAVEVRAERTRAVERDQRRAGQGGAIVVWEPVDEDEIGVTRRQFLNRGIVAAVAFSAATLGAGIIAFLWPTGGGGFGAKITAGSLDDVFGAIDEKREPFYVPAARTYLQRYPSEALPAAAKVYAPPIVSGMEQGITALFQRCPHLGCRVPWCLPSQWFECPCHGSKYNRVGEKKDGPAPRGMDRFAVAVENGTVVIDTASVFQGPPIGTNTTGQQQEGPACV